jgi:hypothetical protein
MPQVGFEPTIPVFERATTVHAADRAVTVIDKKVCIYICSLEDYCLLEYNAVPSGM